MRPSKISLSIFFLSFVFLSVFSCDKNNKKDNYEQNVDSLKVSDTIDTNWEILFDGSNLDKWDMVKPGGWKIEDGALMQAGKAGYIWTKETFGNFILECEFKISSKGNSGIFFRTGDKNDEVQTGIEMQVFDSAGKSKPDKHDCGAIYDLLEPSSNSEKSAGEWNKAVISCKDSIITVDMNDTRIVEMNLNNWKTPHKNPDGTENKFTKALIDFPRAGYIGFQDHGNPVWYRNIKIKRLH